MTFSKTEEIISSTIYDPEPTESALEEEETTTIVTITVQFLNYDGSLLYEATVISGEGVSYNGEIPQKPEDSEFTYEFTGWDKDLGTICTDEVCQAVFKEVPKVQWGEITWRE